jgi:hypothetical protein
MFGRQAVQTLLVKVQNSRGNLGIQHGMPQGKDSLPSKAGPILHMWWREQMLVNLNVMMI